MKRLLAIAAAAAAALALTAAAHAEPAKVGYPNSMASTGDSITRAFNTSWFPFIDAPANSWSTGSSSTVNSQYRRILAANGLIGGRNYNDAVSGAEMVDLNGQVQRAVAQGAEYVTILMGANDVCASTEAGMTPVTTYETQFRTAMATLSAGLQSSRISIVSVPRVWQLWNALKYNVGALTAWSAFGICQSMLANPLSTAQADVDRRARVDQRNRDYNTVLRTVCAEYIHCDYDDDRIFNFPFQPAHVSTRDYFHPSVTGQTMLAAETWAATFDFTDNVAPTSSAAGGLGASITITAADNAAVRGIEYRVGAGSWTRYTGPFTAAGNVVTYRAVDVNGNVEATKTISG
jgi:lysophospholipase L1-like esterase